MKKIVSILLAVLVVFSMFAFTASAAAAPTFTAKADKTDVKVGDTVKVTVSTSKNSKLTVATLALKYDPAYFEVTEKTGAKAFDLETFGEKAGQVRFLATQDVGAVLADSATTLFTVSFKVLKTGGTINLVVEEAYVDEGGKDVNVTADAAKKVNSIKFTEASTPTPPPAECTHANKEEKVTKEATCVEAGTKTTTCKDCGKVLGTATIPATGKHDFADPEVVKAPTCTEKGLEEGKCKNCNTVTQQEIAKVPHEAGEAKVTTQPTCTEAGVKTTTCKNCDAVVKTEQVAKLGHKFGDKAVTKEATCTEKGLKEGKCERCNATVKEEIPMADHKYGEKIVVTAATATKDGKFKRVCSVCGNEKFGVINKTGSKPHPGDLGDAPMGVSMTLAFAAAGLALVTGTTVRRKRK